MLINEKDFKIYKTLFFLSKWQFRFLVILCKYNKSLSQFYRFIKSLFISQFTYQKIMTIDLVLRIFQPFRTKTFYFLLLLLVYKPLPLPTHTHPSMTFFPIMPIYLIMTLLDQFPTNTHTITTQNSFSSQNAISSHFL